MSRVGRNPIQVPQGVEISLNGRDVSVKGGKGQLDWTMPQGIKAEMGDNVISFAPEKENDRRVSALWGTSRAMVANMVAGVSEGFTIKLTLIGVGYRANMQGVKLNLSVGYSHPVLMDVPEGLQVQVNDSTEIEITGADKQKVGQFAAEVRATRPPEPFKGKGIRYANEYIAMKEGKKK